MKLLQMPRSIFAAFLASALLVGLALLSDVAMAAPSIELVPDEGPPTSKIVVSGSGFFPNTSVEIYFDSAPEVFVVTDANGDLRAIIHAPRSAPPGGHHVRAADLSKNTFAQAAFLVQTDWSQFHFKADGTRLNPYENVLNANNVTGMILRWSNHFVDCCVESSPVIVAGVAYIGSWNGEGVFAFNAETGALLWQYSGFQAPYSPAVAGEFVYVGAWNSDEFLALNAHTGTLVWSYATGNVVSSAPAVVNGVVYFGSEDSNVYALNATTGALLWKYTTGGIVFSSPVVSDGIVYFGSDDDNAYALNSLTGEKLWSHKTAGTVGSPAVVDGVVYTGSYALAAKTGIELWSNNIFAPTCPAVAGGMVYFGSNDGNVYALDAHTGTISWKYQTGNIVNSAPAVANGVVYVGSNDHKVYALDAGTGELLFSYTLGDQIEFSSPAVVNGVLYISSDDGNLYAFGLGTGDYVPFR